MVNDVFSVCPGIVVDNVSAAQKLKGCTRIDGILEIQIRGGSKCFDNKSVAGHYGFVYSYSSELYRTHL